MNKILRQSLNLKCIKDGNLYRIIDSKFSTVAANTIKITFVDQEVNLVI